MKDHLLKSLFVFILTFGLVGLVLLNKGKKNRYEHLGGDFSLQHISGPKTLADLKGKVSVLYFGFTTCPDICPMSLNKMERVLSDLSFEQQKAINKVFVSVDYKRDDAKKVADYVKFFAQDIMGLAGTQKQIEEMTKKYAVHFQFTKLKDSALEYTVDHTSRFFLLDKKGKLYNSYSDITHDKSFINDLKRML